MLKFTVRIVFLMFMLVCIIPLTQGVSSTLFEFPTQSGEGKWNLMGPAPMDNCVYVQKVTGGLCSGRVNAIAIDPNNPSTVYIGGDRGGVWKSTNGGSNWIPLTDDQTSLAVGSI